ncbi:HAD family hydrolase [Marinitoga sp. 1138]|uniref:HAD family hydrolase n=1 Tax=Marinitoga sp. 1138 TaxID=1643334 RepID=UPI0015868B8E|nr:HAD hydrolase-like protein [Marinitoga sp. 1138]NUU97603.1 hypothetical protein [Marinitoga sp. 1138]
MMKYKYLFFDMDGTLFETSRGIIYSLQKAYKINNLTPLPEDKIKKLIGPTLDEIMNILFGEENTELKMKVREDFRMTYAKEGVFMLDLYPEVMDTLEKLYFKNRIMYIVTSKPEIFASQILEKFNMSRFFKKICGVPLDGKIPPKSERLKNLIIEENIPLKEGLMIGDTLSDAKAAWENNVDFAWISFGFGHENEIKKYDYKINNFSQLLNLK